MGLENILHAPITLNTKRGISRLILDIYICLLLNQEFYELGISVLGGNYQGRVAHFIGMVVV